MNITSHLTSLYAKKAELEGEIEYEMKRPLPNFLRVTELKKKKMAIKTQIDEFMLNKDSVTA